MKKYFSIIILAVAFAAVWPYSVRAEGCCIVPSTGSTPKQCIPQSGLKPIPPETYEQACFRESPLSASWSGGVPCSSACDATPVGGIILNTGQCCVYTLQNCQTAINGQCDDLITANGPIKGILENKSCVQIDTCGGYQLHTGVGQIPTPPNRWFIPQVTLPGSNFISGQKIEITGQTLGEYIAAFYAFTVAAVAFLAVIMIFYAGMKWLVAGGNMGTVKSAKDQISSALIGLLIALGAYLLLLTISPKLVKFSSLSLRQVEKEEQQWGEVAIGAKGIPPVTVTVTKASLDKVKATTLNGTTIGAIVTNAANEFHVSENLIYAIMMIESGGNPSAVSGMGACGIMQLKPGSALNLLQDKPTLTCADLQNPVYGIRAGAAYLSGIISSTCPSGLESAQRLDRSWADCYPEQTQCKNNINNGENIYVYAAYNGGRGANCSSVDCAGKTWWECEKNTGYAETRAYVQKVQSTLDKIKSF